MAIVPPNPDPDGGELTPLVFEIKKIQKGNNVLLATYMGKLVGKTLSGKWSALDDRYKGEFNYEQQR
jgi:hypothetical protein